MALPSKKKSLKEKDKIRSRVWYERYKAIADTLKEGKCENPVKVLKSIDLLINEAHGYGYDRIACSAYESLKQVVEDMGWKWIDGTT